MSFSEWSNNKKKKQEEEQKQTQKTNTLSTTGYKTSFSDWSNNKLANRVDEKPVNKTDLKKATQGWQKYLEDENASKNALKYDLNSDGKEAWWEKAIGYLSGDGGGVVDTTLPTAGVTQSIHNLRTDVSHARPKDDWTEEQKNAFGELYLDNPNLAYEFAIKTNEANAKEKEEAAIQNIVESSTSNFGKGIGNTIGAIATAPLGLADYLNDLAMANAGRDIAPDGHISPFEYSQAVTGGISTHLNEKSGVLNENIPIIGGKGLGDIYGLGTSILQSMTSAYTLGPIGTLVSYFGQGAASGVDDALTRGATEAQAVLYGTALGAFEGIAESIGIDNLFKLGSTTTIKGYLKNILKQSAAEGMEEGLTSLLSNIADNAIMQDKSNFNYLVSQYMAQGMSEQEARNKAWLSSIEDIAFETIAGAASGGVSGSFHTALQNISSNINAKNIYGDGADLVTEAMEIDPNNEFAQKMQKKANSGKALSGGQINRLVELNEQGLNTQDKAKMKSAVETRLTELGESGDISQLADVIVKTQSGEKLTSSERAILVESKYGRRVSTELNPQSIESGGYSSNWAEDIGTERINVKAYNKELYNLAEEVVGITPAAEITPTEGKSSPTEEKAVESKFEVSADGKTINTKNDEIVTIKNIESVSDYGEANLTLNDGMVVKASDLSFGSDAEAIFVENIGAIKVGKKPISTNSANALYMIAMSELEKNPNMTADEADSLIRGLKESYFYGTYNLGRSKLTARDENGKAVLFAGELTQAQRKFAYELGTKDAASKVEADQKVIDDLKAKADPNSKKKHLGRIIFEKGAEVDESTLTPTQKANLDGVKLLAQISSVEFHVFRSDKENGFKYTMADGTVVSANGWFVGGTNQIWVDLNAGNFGEGTMIRTASHEISHYIKQWSPQKWRAMADLLMNEFAKNGVNTESMLNKQIAKIKRRYKANKKAVPSQSVLLDMAYEELACDALQDMLTDGSIVNFIAEVKAKDMSLAKKIINAIKSLLKKWGLIIDDYKGRDLDTAEAQALSQLEDTFKKLQEMYREAFMDANETVALLDGGDVTGDTDIDGAEGDHLLSDRSMIEGAGLRFIPTKMDGKRVLEYKVEDTKGNAVTEVDEEMVKNSPLGNLVTAAVEGKFISKEDAKVQYEFLADLVNMCIQYKGIAPIWETAGTLVFSAIKNNADKQYGKTIDFSTVCKKTQAIVDAMSGAMLRLGRGLTRAEVETIYLEVGKAGEETPCPVCYVFSRWMGIGGILDQMSRFQNKYVPMKDADIRAFMEDIEDRIEKRANTPNNKGELKAGFFDKDGNIKQGQVIADLKGKASSKAASALKALAKNSDIKLQIQELEALANTQDEKGKKATTKKINSLKKKLVDVTEAEAIMRNANDEVELYEAYQWLTRTLMVKDANGNWVRNKNFKSVPMEVLFDLNKGDEFASGYPLSWAFRTGKGASAGKAIVPYADARVGETIQGIAKSDIKDIKVGLDLNPFLNGDSKTQANLLETARIKQKRQNLIGGQRYQSTSDFRYEYGSDYLITFLEMQAIGAKVQLYTKVIEAVDFLATVGAECNLSVMPLSDGFITLEDGTKKLVYSSVTGINGKAAIEKTHQYNNVQLILVGISDEHIRLALEGDEVTFVIPFHGSGNSVHQIQALMNLLGENLDVTTAQDYTPVQSDHHLKKKTQAQKDAWNLRKKIIMGKAGTLTANEHRILKENAFLDDMYRRFYEDESAEEYEVALTEDQANQIFPYEYWDKSLTYDQADQNGERFKQYCETLGIVPRFSGVDSDGKNLGFGDFTNIKGYWKLLIDRRMYENVYDADGNWIGYGKYHHPQTIDVTNFKAETIDPEWGTAHYGEVMAKSNDPKKTNKIVDAAIAQFENKGETMFSERVTDKETLDFLNEQLKNGEVTEVYRAMAVDDDGNLYPPMAGFVRKNGKKIINGEPSVIGEWEQSTESILWDSVDEEFLIANGFKHFPKPNKDYPNGRFERESTIFYRNKKGEWKAKFHLDKDNGDTVDAAYAPYIHTSLSVLNDQFTSAYKRDNLVVVRGYVPNSEINGVNGKRYQANFADKPVGKTKWHSGVVAAQMPETRTVILSRYFMPIEKVDDAVVAQKTKEMMKGKDIEIPFNVVTPRQRRAMEEIGIRIGEARGLKDAPKKDDVKYSERVSNKELASMDDTALYIKNTKKANYIGMIFNGTKTEETRSQRTLDAFIGKDFYVTDGKYVYGSVVFGEPHKYTDEEFHKLENRKKHRVPKGDTYDVKPGGIKWAYPIESYKKFDKPKKLSDSKEYKNSFQARQVMYSDRDKAYMDAVANGDMETAQRLVDEIAAEAGYWVKAYHGTSSFGFTKFDPKMSDDKTTLFFTDDIGVAKTYAGRDIRGVKNIADAKSFKYEKGKVYTEEELKAAHDFIQSKWHVYGTTKINVEKQTVTHAGTRYSAKQIMEMADNISKQGIYGVYLNTNNFLEVDVGYKGWRDIKNPEVDEWKWEINYQGEGEFNYFKAKADDVFHLELFKNGESVHSGTIEFAKMSSLLRNAIGSNRAEMAIRNSTNGSGMNFNTAYSDKNGNYVKGTMTTREFAQYAKKQGYSGVVIKNMYDWGNKNSPVTARFVIDKKGVSTIYILFDSEQVKSADPVTYDNNGIIIPLSQRFNKDNDDIRYSDRDTSISNRAILANALESVAQNDIEKNKLAEYKKKISQIENEEQRLSAIQKKLFTKGGVEPENRKKLQFEAKQIANRINTYDRQLLNLESTTALKNVLNREKQLAMKRQKQKDNEALAKYKEKVAADKRVLLDKYQDSRKKAMENRNKTAMRHKIKKVVGDLNTLLLRPTKERHIPEEMRTAVAEALDLVNMDTVDADARVEKYNELIAKAKDPDIIASLTETRDRIKEQGNKLADKLTKLKEAYDVIQASTDEDLKSIYDDVIYNKIDSVKKKVGKTPIRNMTLEQLESVYELYTMVLTTVRDSNKAFAENIKLTRDALGSNTFGEIKDANLVRDRIKHQAVEKFLWQNLKPMQAMKTIGSGTLQKLWNNILYGQEVFAQDFDEAVKFAKDMKEKYGYDKWDLNKLHSFESKSGKVMKINLEQMMSIYAYSKRHQADEHIEYGGILLNEGIIKEKNKWGKIVEYKVNDSTAYRLDKKQVEAIIASLEKEAPGAKDFVDEMQKYLSEVMGEKGNEVAMKMYGIRLFKEEHYFPLKSSKDFMEAANAKLKGDVKIKNKGMTKATVEHARNPIVLENFLDVWGNHINEMALYHGLVLPLEDFSRTLNYGFKADDKANVDAESVRTALHDAFGDNADNYLNNLLKAINGGVLHDSTAGFANKMISKFKKAKVMASLSVIVQQPTAIIRAMGIINPKYFVAQKFDHKATWEELKKYCPTAIIKEAGSFDTNMGRTIVDMIKEERGFTDKVGDVLGKAPAFMDEVGWNMIWRALKNKVATEQKLTGEALLQECGKQMTLILNETQVYDSVMARNELMRSKDGLTKLATSFMAEPTTVINMIYGAALDIKRGYKKMAGKTIAATIGSLVVNGLVSAMVYALRDDDEDDTLLEKYLSAATTEVLDGLNPLTYIPFVKDAYSIFQGYKVERADMSLIQDVNDAINGFYNVLDPEAYEDMSRKEIAEHIYDNSVPLLTSICDMFGLPTGNILRDAEAFIVWKDIPMSQTTGAGTVDALKEGAISTLPKFIQKIIGTESKQDKLYDAIVSGDATQINRLKSGYKDDKAYETAVRKALRENDPRIKEAAEARIGGNIAEYTRIVKQIKAEGFFSQDTIVASVNAEINAINKGESSSSESATEDKASSIYKMDDYYASIVGGDEASAYVVKEDIINIDVENGKDRDEAEDSFNSRFASYLREQYEDGYISEDEAKDMLVNYGEKSEEDAMSKVQYWEFKQNYPDYDDLSEEAVAKYYDKVESYGISIDTYYDYSKQRSKCKGADANGDGKTDSGSVKAEVLQVINSLPLTYSQKDALYYLNGWSAKTIYEAPWH